MYPPEYLEAHGPPNGSQSYHEGAESGGVGDRRCLGSTRRSVLGVVLLLALDLRIMTRRSVVLDAIADVDVGVDVLTDVIQQGLIDHLVDVAVVALASLWVRSASILVWVPFIVAPGPSIEIGAAHLISGAVGASALASLSW